MLLHLLAILAVVVVAMVVGRGAAWCSRQYVCMYMYRPEARVCWPHPGSDITHPPPLRFADHVVVAGPHHTCMEPPDPRHSPDSHNPRADRIHRPPDSQTAHVFSLEKRCGMLENQHGLLRLQHHWRNGRQHTVGVMQCNTMRCIRCVCCRTTLL